MRRAKEIDEPAVSGFDVFAAEVDRIDPLADNWSTLD